MSNQGRDPSVRSSAGGDPETPGADSLAESRGIARGLGESVMTGAHLREVTDAESANVSPIATVEDVHAYLDRSLPPDMAEVDVNGAATRLLNVLILMTNRQPGYLARGQRPEPGRPIVVPISTEGPMLKVIPTIDNRAKRNPNDTITTAQFERDYYIDMAELAAQLADRGHTEAYPNVGQAQRTRLNGFLADYTLNNPPSVPPLT